ncbi:MAG: GDP-mannose 4,6-dehydratase [Caldiserica bacterium]|jgi:UDP-glucose 4-epimerase|nr:GDP-mannose 4,6-dehydratase [Caldisericota bacterium]MDH7562173.1 GDP-mannose 4,6-dehydratase [Caldisericota bacterium]
MGTFLVTGGAGFIGSHLVDLLLSLGHQVKVLDNLSTGSLENLNQARGKIEFYQGDVRFPEKVPEAFRGVEGVFHLAAISSVERSIHEPQKAHEVNAVGTLKVLSFSKNQGIKRVVFVSSASVYGNPEAFPVSERQEPRPLSPYGTSKLEGEAHALAFFRLGYLQTVSLRFFNIYGPRQDPSSPYSGVISKFLEAAVSGRKPVLFGDGKQTRDFLFVEDACRAMILAMEKESAPGQVFNVGSGKETSILELGKAIFFLKDLEFNPERKPERQGDIRRSVASIEKIREILRWEPLVPLGEGLRKTLKWVESL